MNKQIIDINQENNKQGIYIHQLDDKSDPNSIAYSSIKDTFEIINQIIEKNTRISQESDSDRCCKKTRKFRPVFINNIVPLLGGRGTGKTSILESLKKSLVELSSTRNGEGIKSFIASNIDKDCTLLKTKFICLDRIEVDCLTSHESILEHIVKNMNHYLEQERDPYVEEFDDNKYRKFM